MLIVDTSTVKGWVALVDRGNIVAEREFETGQDTGGAVLAAVAAVLSDKQTKRVAVHIGPGRYSSALRAGATVASTLAEVWGARLVEVEGNDRADILAQAQTNSPVEVVQLKYGWKGW